MRSSMRRAENLTYTHCVCFSEVRCLPCWYDSQASGVQCGACLCKCVRVPVSLFQRWGSVVNPAESSGRVWVCSQVSCGPMVRVMVASLVSVALALVCARLGRLISVTIVTINNEHSPGDLTTFPQCLRRWQGRWVATMKSWRDDVYCNTKCGGHERDARIAITERYE